MPDSTKEPTGQSVVKFRRSIEKRTAKASVLIRYAGTGTGSNRSITT